MQDLPVALALPPGLRDEVAAFVETEAGWQVVGLEGPPRPALVVATEPVERCDSVVVVRGEPDPDALRAALQAGALDVIAWPDERARLLDAPTRLRPLAPRTSPALVRVAGARGGVGTSTVALALAGLVAWSGRRAVIVGGDDVLELCGIGPWQGAGVTEIGNLDATSAGVEVAALSRPVAGVPNLRALGGGRQMVSVVDWPADLVVVDSGTAIDADPQVVCARPGPGLVRAAAVGAPVAVVGDGSLSAAGVRRALGGTPAVWLRWSARVARAGARGRVPAALPGTWLRDVRTLARRIVPAARSGRPPLVPAGGAS